MTDRELMQWALEALNRSDYLGWQLQIPIIKALRARLAEPEPEVRWDASAPLVVHPHPAFQTTEPQREWIGLTDEEIQQIQISASSKLSAIYITEAQLKGKNA